MTVDIANTWLAMGFRRSRLNRHSQSAAKLLRDAESVDQTHTAHRRDPNGRNAGMVLGRNHTARDDEAGSGIEGSMSYHDVVFRVTAIPYDSSISRVDLGLRPSRVRRQRTPRRPSPVRIRLNRTPARERKREWAPTTTEVIGSRRRVLPAKQRRTSIRSPTRRTKACFRSRETGVVLRQQHPRDSPVPPDYTGFPVNSMNSAWRTATDPNTGRTYYYHVETRETQWRKPMELASETERQEMEEKERRQRDFFAAMEANILRNLSQDQPNSSSVLSIDAENERGETKHPEGLAAPIQPSKLSRGAFAQRTSSLLRPNLVRTISTMDEAVITDLVKRVPSHRHILHSDPDEISFLPHDVMAKNESFRLARNSSQMLSIDEVMQESQSHGFNLEQLNLQDSGVVKRRQSDVSLGPANAVTLAKEPSFGTILGTLPDDHDPNSRQSSFYGSSALDESSFNFGLSTEETLALQKLAEVSNSMSRLSFGASRDFLGEIGEEEDEDESESSEIVMTRGSAMVLPERRLSSEACLAPRNRNNLSSFHTARSHFDASQSSMPSLAEMNPLASGPYSSSTRFQDSLTASRNERERALLEGDGSGQQSPTEWNESTATNLEWDPTVEEKEAEASPNAVRPKITRANSNKKPAELLASRPGIGSRRNTCGTLYVGSTMSDPDKDASIKCVCGVLRAHILQSELEENAAAAAAATDEYRIFNDLESQQRSLKKKFRPNVDFVVKPPPPSLEDISTFYRDVFTRAQMETDCIIMSLIYVERLVKVTDGKLRPHQSNWRSILFSCMVLSSKVWDDMSMWNADFSQTCPAGIEFTLQRINALEVAVLSALSYEVKVPASEYAKYYFLLRSMIIKSGLGGQDLMKNPLDIEGARRLQAVSERYQVGVSKPGGLANFRSKSVGATVALEGSSNKDTAIEQPSQKKIGLEHVMRM